MPKYIQHEIILVGAASSVGGLNQSQRPKFVAVSTLEDVQVNNLPDLKSRRFTFGLKPGNLNLRPCDVLNSTLGAVFGRWAAIVKR